jgi:hypothetical protein
MTDKEWFENNPTLDQITGNTEKLNKIIYENIMQKYIKSGNDILNLPHEANDYLVENFLWRDDVAFVVGKEKACKSILTSQKAMAMTCGEAFLGSFEVARPLRVLYIQAEGSLGETKTRLVSSLGKNGLNWNPDNWAHCFPPSLALDTQEGYEEFKDQVERSCFNPEVVIIDPLYCAMDGDLIDNKAVRRFNSNVRKLKEAWLCSFIIVHHEHRPKTDIKGFKVEEGDNSIFGSSMLKNFASHVLRISITNSKGTPINNDEDGKPKYRKLMCSTQRNGNVVKKVMMKLNEDPLMFEAMEKGTSGTEHTVLMSLQSHGPSTYDMIVNNTGMNKGTVRNSVCTLKKKGKVRNNRKEGQHVYLEAI